MKPASCMSRLFASYLITYPLCSSRTPLDESDAPYIPPIPSPQPILLQHEARLPPPHRRQEKNTLVFVETDPDADDESDGNASDDEYLPSPPLKPHTLKRCATTPLNQFGIAAISTGLTSTSAFGSHQHPVKRPRASPPSRNIQATPFSPSPTSAGLDAPSKSNPWACPHCSWVQRNRRTPDLKRHIRTHTRLLKPSQWVCCGVPVEEAASYAIRSDSESRLHDGRYVVGGCWKEFSRRDALKRHLDNSNIGCVGNLNAFLTED
jgi:hypothetical protein